MRFSLRSFCFDACVRRKTLKEIVPLASSGLIDGLCKYLTRLRVEFVQKLLQKFIRVFGRRLLTANCCDELYQYPTGSKDEPLSFLSTEKNEFARPEISRSSFAVSDTPIMSNFSPSQDKMHLSERRKHIEAIMYLFYRSMPVVVALLALLVEEQQHS